MTLQQLTYFLSAIEQGTFSRAAEALDIAQPTLSEHILKLENTLGTRVFIRTPRRLVLTEAGRRLEPFARSCVMAQRQGYEAVQSARKLGRRRGEFWHLWYSASLFSDRTHYRISQRTPASACARGGL